MWLIIITLGFDGNDRYWSTKAQPSKIYHGQLDLNFGQGVNSYFYWSNIFRCDTFSLGQPFEPWTMPSYCPFCVVTNNRFVEFTCLVHVVVVVVVQFNTTGF